MPFKVKLVDLAEEELQAIRTFDRRRIVDAIKEQLRDQPTVETRNRKCLEDLVPAFEHAPPLWELRIGDYRVFYDVDTTAAVVYVRAVRKKSQGQTTGNIIHD
jgi:mRNA-degrading endonuclease RelE of RelBE toxin-antitoxin system